MKEVYKVYLPFIFIFSRNFQTSWLLLIMSWYVLNVTNISTFFKWITILETNTIYIETMLKSFIHSFSIKTPQHKMLDEMMEHLITILDILQTSVIPFSVVYCNCCFGQEIFGERRKGGKCNEEWMTHPFSLEMATAKP